MKTHRDLALFNRLERYNFFKIFISITFYCSVSASRIMGLYYDFVRGLERRSKGEWFVKVEGDNKQRKRHLHILFGEGFKKRKPLDLKQAAENKLSDLKLQGVDQKKNRLDDPYLDYLFYDDYPALPFADMDTDVRLYDSQLGVRSYLALDDPLEDESLSGVGLDSVGRSNWKMSNRLKKKILSVST